MRLLAELLLFPITGPIRGLEFIVKQIQAELEAELMNEDRVQGQLAELSLRHDLGEISGPEYEEKETALLEELDMIRAYQEGLIDEYLTLDVDAPPAEDRT
ncbi:MAG TPA: gas vesicle protein GvpG [Chloroflexota bacterium]|nr:gas vesicle protein GvpG [Chloroflexota bacterium]